MPTGPPGWLALLSPIPADAKPGRKPVASAEQIEKGTAGPIAGWQSISVHLSEPEYGLRHVLITLDENGQLLSGGDHVMFVRETAPHDDSIATVTDHESVGGRFESDGSFRGTYWKTTLESPPGGYPASRVEDVLREAVDPHGTEIAVLNGDDAITV